MNKQGRKPFVEAKTAYDYRRAILLVQVHAMMNSKGKRAALETLAVEWIHYPPEMVVLVGDEELLQLLSQHALEHGQGQ